MILMWHHPKYYKELAKKRKQADYWNLDGSALSYLAQQMEGGGGK